MYQIGQNLHDDPNSDGFHTAVRISVRPVITFPFPRDQTAITFSDQYVQQYDSFTPLAVGTCHPYLKKEISGTIAIANNTDVVTGTGTTFVTDFLVDDIIWINGQSKVIQAIDSDTQITLESLYDGVTVTGMTSYRAQCFLTHEGNFNYLDNGVMEFSREYASLPEGRTEWGTTGFTFPAYRHQSSDTDNPERKQFNSVVVAKSTYTYIRTNTPATAFTILPEFQPLDPSSNQVNFVATDTNPTKADYQALVTAESYIRSAETKVDPWMGNIWQMLNIEVIAK